MSVISVKGLNTNVVQVVGIYKLTIILCNILETTNVNSTHGIKHETINFEQTGTF
jgi:hypothetical protein